VSEIPLACRNIPLSPDRQVKCRSRLGVSETRGLILIRDRRLLEKACCERHGMTEMIADDINLAATAVTT